TVRTAAPAPATAAPRARHAPARQAEHHVLGDALERPHALGAEFFQPLHELAHQDLGRRGAGGHADAALARDPLGTQVVGAVHHVGVGAHVLGDLAQAV